MDKFGIPLEIDASDEPGFTTVPQVIKYNPATGDSWVRGLQWYKLAGPFAPISLSNVSNFLTSDVPMTNADEFYDGPSVELVEGTWLITGSVVVESADNTAQNVTVKLVSVLGDVTEHATGQASMPAMGASTPGIVTIPIFLITEQALENTFTLQVAATEAGSTILSTCPDNGVTDKASSLHAVRIVTPV